MTILWEKGEHVDKKFKLLASCCMILLVAVGFFGSVIVVDAPEPTPTVAVAEYDYYVVAAFNMTPTLPPPAPQISNFTFTCTANNNATSTGYNFGNLDCYGGREYLYDGCAETSSPYNDNAYVTVNITNNFGYTITIEDLTAEVTDGTPTKPWLFGLGPDWGMGNMTVIAVDTLDPWDPGAATSYDEVNYSSGAVTVHRDPSMIVRDGSFGIVRGYPDWFRKATGEQGWPYPATQLGPGSLLENDLNGDAAATGHVKPVALANGATFTEYFGITLFGQVDPGTQINATITLRLTYTPPPEGAPAVCDVDIANAITVAPSYRASDTIEVFEHWNLPINVTVNNVGTVPLNGTVNGYYSLDKATWLSMGASQPISLNPCNRTLLVFTWHLQAAGVGESIYFLKFNATATNETLTDNDEFSFNLKIRVLGDSDGDNDVDIADLRKIELSMFTSYPQPIYLQYNSFPVFTDLDGDGDVDVRDHVRWSLNVFKTWPGPIGDVWISIYSPAGSIGLVPSNVTLYYVGQTITVIVAITNITDCAGYQLRINYNSTLLQCDPWYDFTFDTGSPLSPTQVAPASNNRIDQVAPLPGSKRMSTIWRAGVPTYSGNGVVAKITFKALATGSTSLVLDQAWTYATDSTGNDILFQTYTEGWVPGDVDGDRDVDVGDQRKVQLAMFSSPGDPNWNPNADIDNDLDVDVGDQRTQQNYMFQSW